MSFIERGSGGAVHPAGIFIGTIRGCKIHESISPEGKPRKEILWEFNTNAPDVEGCPAEIAYWTAPFISPKSKLGNLIERCGYDPADKYWDTIDESLVGFDCMKGRQCTLVIEQYKTQQQVLKSKITNVLPLQAIPVAAPVVAAPAPPVVATAPITDPATAPFAPEARELVGAGVGAPPTPHPSFDA